MRESVFYREHYSERNVFQREHILISQEYAGYKKGDFHIDGDIVVEVGGEDKGFGQLAGQEHSFVAADDIESAYDRKIPLWAFGFLY